MKVALTGATGHLGGALVRELHARDYTIRALVRTQPPDIFENIPVEWVTGDLLDDHALDNLTSSCDALIHSAGLISIRGEQGGKVRQINVEGTGRLMTAAKKNGIRRVVHISSIQAYQQTPSHVLLDESSPKTTDDAFAYDRSKRDGENLALSFASDQMEVIVVNPTSIIGPYDYKPSRMGKALIQMGQGKLPFVLKGGTDFCDARDLAHAIVNGLTIGRSGESYLLSGHWHSLKELGERVGQHTGHGKKTIALPLVFAWMGLPFTSLASRMTGEEPVITREAIVAVRDGNRHISSEKAKRELGYTPRPFEVMVRDVCDWFLKNGYLEQSPK